MCMREEGVDVQPLSVDHERRLVDGVGLCSSVSMSRTATRTGCTSTYSAGASGVEA